MNDFSSKEFDYWVKILIIGDSGVGKTTAVCRYVDGHFNGETKPTIGIDSK